MGFFSRIGCLIKGFFIKAADRAEEKNPELLLEDISLSIAKAKKRTAEQILEIQTNAELLKMEMNDTKNELKDLNEKIEVAAKNNEKELLIELYLKEERLLSLYNSKKEIYENAVKEVDRINNEYELFKQDMTGRLNEINNLKARARMAKINETISIINTKQIDINKNVGNINQKIDRLKEVVNKKTARANVLKNFEENSSETAVKKLEHAAIRQRAEKKAEDRILKTIKEKGDEL